MIITREEFKELVELYRQTWDKCHKCIDYYNEEVIYDLAFPALDWINNKIVEDTYEDFLDDASYAERGKREMAVKWRFIQVSEDEYECEVIEYSSDLDKIYDAYILRQGEVK